MRVKRIQSLTIKLSIAAACLVIVIGFTVKVVKGPASSGGPAVARNTQATSTIGQKTSTAQTAGSVAAPTQPLQLHGKAWGKVVAIGDSYTAGYPVGSESSWVNLAAHSLGNRFVNMGKSSQTSNEILARFNPDIANYSPKTVIVLAGTGDGIKGIPLEKFQANIQAMVAQAKAKKVNLILGLPLLYPDQHAKDLIKSYRSWLITYATQQKIDVLDFNPTLFDQNENYRKGLSNDGKYPNKAGYAAMAQVVEKLLK